MSDMAHATEGHSNFPANQTKFNPNEGLITDWMLADARPKTPFSDSMGRQVHSKERLVTGHNRPTPDWAPFVGWGAGKGILMPQHGLRPT